MINSRVSIVIPCFNAEKWIGEAVESALSQTNVPVEVIVIDDGSSDRSLQVIKSFDSRIRWESGPNRGGNHARNRGVSLAIGQFIQFLDADDYLLPGKIARQLEVLESRNADVVYEDWQRLDERPDGSSVTHPIEIAGPHLDVLEALLSSWAPPPCAFLFRRTTIDSVKGWDESLSSAQDWEFNIRVAMSGAKYIYTPGCLSVYRRPARKSLSTRSMIEMHTNVLTVLRRTEDMLIRAGRFSACYKRAMAASYFSIARSHYSSDRTFFSRMLSEARRLSHDFARLQPLPYRMICNTLGVEAAERIASLKRKVVGHG